MDYEGRIFRPPSEAYSLIVQITAGCSHNGCRFCDMYKEKNFHVKPLARVLDDLHEARTVYPYVRRVFLTDGDALICRYANLETILTTIARLFPECERVTCYASPKSILLKTPEQLAQLQAMGLKMVYMGLESGNDAVLAAMHKGVTRSQIIEAGQKVRAAGMALSVTAISGLGGYYHWVPHAIDTATALNAMAPEYIGLLTLRLEGQAPLAEDVKRGDFIMLTPEEIAQETCLMLEWLDCEGAVFRSNHISNYISLAGTLNRDKPAMLEKLHQALAGKVLFKSEAARHWDLNLY